MIDNTFEEKMQKTVSNKKLSFVSNIISRISRDGKCIIYLVQGKRSSCSVVPSVCRRLLRNNKDRTKYVDFAIKIVSWLCNVSFFCYVYNLFDQTCASVPVFVASTMQWESMVDIPFYCHCQSHTIMLFVLSWYPTK